MDLVGRRFSLCFFVAVTLSVGSSANLGVTPHFRPVIPKTWDDKAIVSLELSAPTSKGTPIHVSAEFYYKQPIRPIYKSYAVYALDREPAGYFDWLRRQEPQVIWGKDSNQTEHRPPLDAEADWIRAGELVFDAPVIYDLITTVDEIRNPEWWLKIHAPVQRDGTLPFYRYVIRDRGKVELGSNECSTCHIRVMGDGSIIKGAQGNFPIDRAEVYSYRTGRLSPKQVRANEASLFAAPWMQTDPYSKLDRLTIEEIAEVHEAIPPGVVARHRSSPFCPPHIPSLIGVKDRYYLDATGLQPQRSIVDLMRYAALNQGEDDFASYDGFRPVQLINEVFFGKPKTADPEPSDFDRYSDEQLYALARYVYSLQPPANPNPYGKLAIAGRRVFEREGCPTCHTPPLYTNNKLTPAIGFHVPEEHKSRFRVLQIVVGTDARLTMETRRGTGYYKVPSLQGLWFRGAFEHNGSVATLEDWLDANRLKDDYVPTGFKGYGVKARAVTGHPFGLTITSEEKRARLAFLKTL